MRDSGGQVLGRLRNIGVATMVPVANLARHRCDGDGRERASM
jgi:hypothetical protein